MKKAIFILMIFNFSFFSCSKESKSATKINEQKNIQVQSEQNPDFLKIEKIFSLMSERAQTELKIFDQDKNEFLKDLNIILDEEKNFDSSDLSLFYLIDKKNLVSENYVPKLIPLTKNEYYTITKNNLSLRPEAKSALKEMAEASLKDNILLTVSSTYRSYEYQKNLFAYWVKVDGLEEAERESARPGTSQHQLGCAIDFGDISDDFIKTDEGLWLSENAWKYGWSLSFPKNYEDITGYRWECWHYRYIGKNACRFQKKWFNDVQQYMIEFINLWKNN